MGSEPKAPQVASAFRFVAEDKILVTGLKGPLEDGWQAKVATFATRIPIVLAGLEADRKSVV